MFTGPWQWRWTCRSRSPSVSGSVTRGSALDLFNWMNHPTFYVYPATGGDYALTSPPPFNINSPTFGQITDMNFNPRIIQIGAYYQF